ncbi:unnamed protein product [marine sediment metagenome]|uniref:Uncharacterized protein n=1 Tax=marine sediment metagenome TaxID=412755 RepID=X1GV64_9ZZZZ
MGNRNTPRKRVKRLFEQSQNQLAMLFRNLQTIRAFHEGRDTEEDLYGFFGVALDRLAELSTLVDVARFRFGTGKWPEKAHAEPSECDQVRDPGDTKGTPMGAAETADDDNPGAPPGTPAGNVGEPVDPGDA